MRNVDLHPYKHSCSREEHKGNSPQLAASSEFSSNQLPAEHNWSSNYAGGRHQRSDWPPPLGGHQVFIAFFHSFILNIEVKKKQILNTPALRSPWLLAPPISERH
ncbi:hypothetical protein ACLKA6_005913 [Drosophila palustris]